MTYETPALGYDYDALEPYFDAQTMEIHHDRHHAAYTAKLNAAVEQHPELFERTAEELITHPGKLPEDIRQAVINNGGGHVNHAFFWPLLKKDVPAQGPIIDAINEQFGSFEEFKESFSKAAATRFGSGWAWLVHDNGKLKIMSTANQDTPLAQGKTPLLALDVWEHSYYLKYQNKRPDYIEAFFKVVNWEKVNEHFMKAKE